MKVPKGWRIESLAWGVASLESGVSEGGEDRLPAANEAAVLKVSAVTTGRFSPDNCKAIARNGISHTRTSVKGDCILVNRANGSAALVGISVYVAKPHPNRYLPDKIWQLTAHPDRSSGRYLGLITSMRRFRDDVLNRSSGGTGMRNIGAGRYLEIDVLFPPLPEQFKIADILGTWDEALEKLDTLIAAKDRRKGLLRGQLIGHFCRSHSVLLAECVQICPSNVDKKTGPNEVPVRLCNYTDVYYREIIDANVPFMAASALPREIAKFTLRKGDVLITKDSEEADDIAVPALVSKDLPGVLCGYHLALLRPHPDRIDGRYLAHTLRLPSVNYQFSARANGVTRYGLTIEAIGSILVPVPSPAEQSGIADILDDADTELRLLRKQREALDLQKRGLMQRLLTGKVRVS